MARAGNRGGGRFQMLRAALACALVTAASARPASAALTHLYTFNNGTAADSQGSAHGTILGNAFVDGDGVLRLPGGGSDFVSLNGPAINIASYTDVTFEAWFTFNAASSWQRVFDFGDRTVPAAQQGYIYYTPQGATNPLAVYATGGARTEASHAALQAGQRYHLAMVIDDDANGGLDQMRVYIDGAQVATANHSRSLSNVGTAFAYIGESLITGDPNFNGAIDEFRIYNHVLSPADIILSRDAGPTPVERFRLEVNTVTGLVTMVGLSATSTVFDYYSITSAGGQLDPLGWNSFDDQNLDAIGTGTGESWDKTSPHSGELTELYIYGATTASPGERIELGHAYNPSVAGLGEQGDLFFEFSPQLSPIKVRGDVIYVTPDPLDGDYNGDSVVNAADYVIWRNALATGDMRADGDNNGRIDRDDYLIWKYTYGNSGGEGASLNAADVPEPAGLVLLLASLLSLAACGRRRAGRSS